MGGNPEAIKVEFKAIKSFKEERSFKSYSYSWIG
jgi:hypothetical protein